MLFYDTHDYRNSISHLERENEVGVPVQRCTPHPAKSGGEKKKSINSDTRKNIWFKSLSLQKPANAMTRISHLHQRVGPEAESRVH